MIIFIYGAPGSGKTTIGKKLNALIYESIFFDLDLCIEKETNLTISEIFKWHGEDGFRQIESKVLQKLVSYHKDSIIPIIISLGGGALLLESNRKLCESSGKVFFLEPPSEEELTSRILSDGCKTRPLGNQLSKRAAHYGSFLNKFHSSDFGPILECMKSLKFDRISNTEMASST